MPRALARKKTSAKSSGSLKSKSKSGKPAARAKPPARKSKHKAPEKTKKKTAASKPAAKPAAKEGVVMVPETRKRVSPFGTVTPAPDKPPRVLPDTKQTTAALALLEKGIKLIYQKEFKKARHELQSIAALYSAEAEIIARSRSYLQICEREEATHKKQVVAQDQLYALGVMEHNRDNYEKAIDYFQQMLEKHPNADYVYYSLAASQACTHDAAAVANLRKAIQLNEDNRVYAKNDPDFVPLHAEREFAELVGLTIPSGDSPQS